MPGVVDPRHLGEPHLADDLGPAVQRRIGVLPPIKRKGRPSLKLPMFPGTRSDHRDLRMSANPRLGLARIRDVHGIVAHAVAEKSAASLRSEAAREATCTPSHSPLETHASPSLRRGRVLWIPTRQAE